MHCISFYWEDQPVWIGVRLTLSLEDIFQIAYYRIIVKYRRISWWKLPRKIYKFITKTHNTHTVHTFNLTIQINQNMHTTHKHIRQISNNHFDLLHAYLVRFSAKCVQFIPCDSFIHLCVYSNGFSHLLNEYFWVLSFRPIKG